jgi:hypothetical protein
MAAGAKRKPVCTRPSARCLQAARWLAASHNECVLILAARTPGAEPYGLRKSVAEACGIADEAYPRGRVLRRVWPAARDGECGDD